MVCWIRLLNSLSCLTVPKGGCLGRAVPYFPQNTFPCSNTLRFRNFLPKGGGSLHFPTPAGFPFCDEPVMPPYKLPSS